MSTPLSMDGALRLIEFVKAQEAIDPAINSRAKLEREIKKILIFSCAYQSATLRGDATDAMLIQQRAMEEYHRNPVFHAFIEKQCVELMQVFSRVDRNLVI